LSTNLKVANHNLKVRCLLFLARPFHLFNVVLLVDLWRYLHYGPTTLPNYFGRASAAQVTESLWQEHFSPYIMYFVIVAIIDLAVQEFLPLINND
jgi:hypothetical protein